MTSADLLLFRRSRGLFWGALVITVVAIPVLFLIAAIIFAPAQGETVFPDDVVETGIGILTLLSAISAVLLGATAGSVDHQRGVLRDLVLAGKPRWRIVLGRLAAATTWLVLACLACIALVLLIALGLSPDEGTLDVDNAAHLVISLGPWLLSALGFGAGIAMLIGSRGPAIGIYLAFTVIVDSILRTIPTVGDAWAHISYSLAQGQVLEWITGGDTSPDFVNSNGMALFVLVCWGVIPFVAGVVRLSNRDL